MKRIMPNTMACLTMLFALATSCLSQPDETDWLRIEGNQLVNESGEKVVFHGVNIRDPHNLDAEGHWTLAHFEMARSWGANVIRLPIHPKAWRERGQEAYLN